MSTQKISTTYIPCTGGYKYSSPEEAKEMHKMQSRERARLEHVKQQRREREKKKKEYMDQLEENYQNLQIMYQQLYNQYIYLQNSCLTKSSNKGPILEIT